MVGARTRTRRVFAGFRMNCAVFRVPREAARPATATPTLNASGKPAPLFREEERICAIPCRRIHAEHSNTPRVRGCSVRSSRDRGRICVSGTMIVIRMTAATAYSEAMRNAMWGSPVPREEIATSVIAGAEQEVHRARDRPALRATRTWNASGKPAPLFREEERTCAIPCRRIHAVSACGSSVSPCNALSLWAPARTSVSQIPNAIRMTAATALSEAMRNAKWGSPVPREEIATSVIAGAEQEVHRARDRQVP